MSKFKLHLKDVLVAIIILGIAFGISLIFQNNFQVNEHITTLFVFAIFIISYLSDGYLCGILSSCCSVLLINFAFTYPYFIIDFTSVRSFVSAIIMIVISILTSTLTTRIKAHEREKAEALKERMRANLLRAISHDLRTPLTTIYTSANLLLEEELAEDRKRQILEAIKEDSDWLVHMVENLLSITRIDSGQLLLTKNDVVLDELIDSVLIKFKKRYPNQNIEVDIPDEIIMIAMDATLIEQVLINLLENAVIHAKGMTKLSLRVYAIGKRVIFEIADDGCGLSMHNSKHLFTKQSENSEIPCDANKQNMGIGLTVCNTIIKAHGGHIMATNQKAGGAIFRFELLKEDDDVQ